MEILDKKKSTYKSVEKVSVSPERKPKGKGTLYFV